MLFVTFLVDAVAAVHKHNGPRRGEEILATDGTIAVCRPLDTLVRALNRRRDACTTGLAMEKVLAQTHAASTNTTVAAMVDGLALAVLP